MIGALTLDDSIERIGRRPARGIQRSSPPFTPEVLPLARIDEPQRARWTPACKFCPQWEGIIRTSGKNFPPSIAHRRHFNDFKAAVPGEPIASEKNLTRISVRSSPEGASCRHERSFGAGMADPDTNAAKSQILTHGGKSTMARPSDEITTQSVHATRRFSLPEVAWESVNEPGAYVEKGSGDLYRIPKEALIPGASPAIVKESRGASVLVKLSEDPFLTTFNARLLCFLHNIEANF